MENNNNGLPEYRVGNGSASGPEAAHAREDIPNMEQDGYDYGTQNSGNNDRYAYGQQAQKGENYQQAGGYQQEHSQTVPPYMPQNNQYGNDTSVLGIGQWVMTLIMGMIPCVGIILYIVWGFSSAGNENRKNFCRAQLLIIAVLFVLYILVAVMLGFSAFRTISANPL